MLVRAGLAALAAAGMIAGGYLIQTKEVHFYGNTDFSVEGEVLNYRGRPFTGVTRETFPDGSVFRRTTYKDGLKHGPSEEFATTGARRALWNYVSGKKEGLQKGWYIEGPREFELSYRAGLLDGVSTEWYLNGGISRQRTFKAGTEVALKLLYQTGEVFTNYVVRDERTYGIRNGEVCMDYGRDGEIR